MSIYFVDQGAAAGGATGADWPNAFLTLAAALAVATSADTIYVANTHSNLQASANVMICPTTPGLRILSVIPNGTSGHSGVAAGAVEGVGAVSQLVGLYGFAYIYGIDFTSSSTNSSSSFIQLGYPSSVSSGLFLDSCRLTLRNVSTQAKIFLGASSATGLDDIEVRTRNLVLKFAHSSQWLASRYGQFHHQGMSIDPAGAAPTTLLAPSNDGNGWTLIEASDLSGVSFTNLLDQSVACGHLFTVRNTRLPSGITPVTGAHVGPGGVVLRMHNCNAGDVHYDFYEADYAGTAQDEATIVRTGGGATSVRLDSSADAKFPYPALRVRGMVYNSAVGSPKTLTVEIVHDTNVAAGQGAGASFAFQDDQIWVEVQHQGTSGYPQGVIDLDDRKADVLTSAADQASSSASWTLTGLTTPVRQKLECTFTPAEVGYVFFDVCFAAASKFAYADILGATIT